MDGESRRYAMIPAYGMVILPQVPGIGCSCILSVVTRHDTLPPIHDTRTRPRRQTSGSSAVIYCQHDMFTRETYRLRGFVLADTLVQDGDRGENLKPETIKHPTATAVG